MEDEILLEGSTLGEEMGFCPRCGTSQEEGEGFCRRCCIILHFKDRLALMGRVFGVTFFFILTSSLILSFQGRFGIHTDWFQHSLLFGVIIGLLATLVAVTWKGIRDNG